MYTNVNDIKTKLRDRKNTEIIQHDKKLEYV